MWFSVSYICEPAFYKPVIISALIKVTLGAIQINLHISVAYYKFISFTWSPVAYWARRRLLHPVALSLSRDLTVLCLQPFPFHGPWWKGLPCLLTTLAWKLHAQPCGPYEMQRALGNEGPPWQLHPSRTTRWKWYRLHAEPQPQTQSTLLTARIISKMSA